MDDGGVECGLLVGAVLRRWLEQNGLPPLSPAQISGFAGRLWSLIAERGLPRPLSPDECGAPGGMPATECAPLVVRLAGDLPGPHVPEAARQLVKACFHPEFRTCRDSFRETASDGACRRQQLVRVRGRLSGSHCVDCPHWVGFSAEEHQCFLAAEWRTCSTGAGRADAAEFLAHRDVFLPEDFRALRRWLHAWARRPFC